VVIVDAHTCAQLHTEPTAAATLLLGEGRVAWTCRRDGVDEHAEEETLLNSVAELVHRYLLDLDVSADEYGDAGERNLMDGRVHIDDEIEEENTAVQSLVVPSATHYHLTFSLLNEADVYTWNASLIDGR
jgi:hypothetical protein